MPDQGPTEAVLESTRALDRWSVEEILAAIHREDLHAWEAVGRVLPAIERAVDVLVCVLGGGGRWFNVGAGTSGRMGALDAAEIPPTFGLPPDRVQMIIAGGERALHRAVEGAEDNPEAAAWELRERGLGPGDAVVAISASGHTPFTLGSLEAAHAVGARTIAITCDPALAARRGRRDRHRAAGRSRGDRRLDPHEGRARPEDGAPLALDGRDGAAGPGRREPDDEPGDHLGQAARARACGS